MLDFLTDRLKQRKQQRAALVDQEAQRLQRVERLKGMIALLKELLKDARYEAYTTLLQEAQRSATAEREALLCGRDEDDPQTRHERIAFLSGRIAQLEYILTTPEQFFSLAEQAEANGNAARASVRQPIG